MPTWKNIEATNLEDFIYEVNQRLSWITSRLDSKNVKRLDTNETKIKSADGTTYINGPVLEQRDASDVLRLKQGLDNATNTFLYALFNAAGVQTVGIDSNGNGQFNQVTLRNDLTGSAYMQINASGLIASDGLINTVEIDSTGKAYFRGDITSDATITGAMIRSGEVGSDRIELSGGKFRGLTSSEQITGLFFDISRVNSGLGITDIFLYHNNAKLAVFYDDITHYVVKGASGSDGLFIGGIEATTYPVSDWDFAYSTIYNLITSTDGAHGHGGYTGSGGTDSHTHSISNDGAHFHEVTT